MPAAREVTRFPPGGGGTEDLTISEAPCSGLGEAGLPGLEEKEEISGSPGRAVRSLMLHSPSALLTWQYTANWTVQLPCWPRAAGGSLLLLPIL